MSPTGHEELSRVPRSVNGRLPLAIRAPERIQAPERRQNVARHVPSEQRHCRDSVGSVGKLAQARQW